MTRMIFQQNLLVFQTSFALYFYTMGVSREAMLSLDSPVLPLSNEILIAVWWLEKLPDFIDYVKVLILIFIPKKYLHIIDKISDFLQSPYGDQ